MNEMIEELLPLVEDLSRRYTSGDSTSVTYETAQQLMEFRSVQYKSRLRPFWRPRRANQRQHVLN